MKELIVKYDYVYTDLWTDDINPGDVCKLSCPEEGNEYIMMAVPKDTGPRCMICDIKQKLGVKACYVGCSRKGYYFRQIDNLLEDL